MVLYYHLQSYTNSYKEGMTWNVSVVTLRERNVQRVTNGYVINTKGYR